MEPEYAVTIRKLIKAYGADRETDKEIARLIGSTGEALLNSGSVPHYTRSLDEAYKLATTIASGEDGGVSWEDGLASAKIGRFPITQARTAPNALCAAVLRLIAPR